MTLLEGEIVGPYRIEGQLGQGGMATVYKAYHPQLDRYVAIKVMHQAFLEDSNFLARFQREAQIIARLEHPNIVPVYDYSEYKGQPYLVMKLIEGQTLKSEIAAGALSFEQILNMLGDIAGALTYAHKRGILHRDVKPSNMIVDVEKHPYITDFGLARLVQSGQSTYSADMLIGTPHYMSPEQAKGDQELGPATDIYALGVILYELAVGQVPFSGNTPYAIIHDQIYTPLPLPSVVNSAVPQTVEQVLLKALAKEPAERYSSATEMMDEFRQAVSESGFRLSAAGPAVPLPTSPSPERTVPQPAAPVPVNQRMVSIPAPTAPARPTQRAERPSSASKNRALLLVGIVAVVAVVAIAAMLSRRQSPPAETTLPTLAVLATATQTVENSPVPSVEPGDSDLTFVLYHVPEISVADAQAAVAGNKNDPVNYLALARAFWEEEKNQDAQTALSQGILVDPDKIRYLLSAAAAADEAGKKNVAVFLNLQALGRAEARPDIYPAARNMVGAYLYGIALDPQGIDIDEIRRVSQSLEQTNPIPEWMVDTMATRALITANRLLLADTRLRRMKREDRGRAEVMLVQGELYRAQNKKDAAVKEWQLLSDQSDAPDWVKERADELLQLLTGD